MKRKEVIVVFLASLLLYGIGYYWIEHQRTKNGPWQVTFSSNGSNDDPFIMINHDSLGVNNTKIFFRGETTSQPVDSVIISFENQQDEIPFGKVLFQDPTFLPGTAAFDFFGHEVELLPRVLTLNRIEYPWKPDSVHQLSKEDKMTEKEKSTRKRDKTSNR